MTKLKKKKVVTKEEIEPEEEEDVENEEGEEEEGEGEEEDEEEPTIKEKERAIDILSLEEKIKKSQQENDENADNISKQKDPLRTKSEDGKVVKKTKQKLTEEIKCLEEKLEIQHKPISRWSRKDLEKYLVDLISKCGDKIQEQIVEEKIGRTEVITSKVKVTKDGRKKLVEELKLEIESLREKKNGDNKDKLTITEQAGVEFIYKLNYLLYHALEEGSKITEDKTNINLDGLCDKLEEDKENILIPIYKQLYIENEELIRKYGTPLMQLAYYTITTVALTGTKNLKKKRLMRSQRQE